MDEGEARGMTSGAGSALDITIKDRDEWKSRSLAADVELRRVRSIADLKGTLGGMAFKASTMA